MGFVRSDVEDIIAHLPGVKPVLREHRDRGYAAARSLFSDHDHPAGAKITKASGRLDQYYNLDDSGGAAGAIEWGHTTRGGKAVEGLHVLRRSMSFM